MKKQIQFFKILVATFILSSPVLLSAQINDPVADASIDAFNDAFLITNDAGETAYRRLVDSTLFDSGWTWALNIQGMLDAYERTGSTEHKAILDDLMTSFLVLNEPPYDWDGWNDDLAWIGLVEARAYKMIGNEELLADADYFFRLAYDRGWNTEFNDGGIWEEQPNFSNASSSKSKDALSNNPTGHLAALLYQSTGNQYYLDKAIQIYNWSVSHVFNPKNGHVYAGVYRNGNLNKALTAYSQGAFIDFSSLLYEITGDERMLRNAVLAADYTISQLTTEEGILSTDSRNHNTWGAEFARGLGHLVKSNPELWNKYYPFLKKNSEVTWENRRRDLDLTWNTWAKPTEKETDVMANVYISAVALHQHTPVTQLVNDTIEAEDYNFWEGVNEESIDAGGESVKLSENGDWVEYIVEIPEDGTYTISLDVAATAAASFELQLNHNTTATVDVPATGDFQTYTAVSTAVKLKPGFHSIRFRAVNGELNINRWSAEKCDLIQPSVSVNGADATAVTEVNLNAGDEVLFAPQATGGGTWHWTGPDGFSADTREVSITDFSATQGGVYTAQYVNADGCISSQDFTLSLAGCTTSQQIAVSIYNEGWQEAPDVIEAGSFVKIAGTPTTGNWSWTGPNGFTANTKEITFNNIGYREAGEYTATYYNESGCKSTAQITLELTGQDPCGTPIVPYINVDGWREGTFGSVSAGASFQLGPQASEGSWSWTGPEGFTSDQREFTVTDFDENKAGSYTATFTNENGCESTKEFILGLKGCSSPSIVPEILVDGQPWAYTDSIAVQSGGSFSIIPPDIGGQWSWTGDNNGGERWEGLYGYTSNKRTISFHDVLDIREGTLTLTHVDADACISTYTIDVFVEGDDFCGSEVTPYINANDAGWESSSTATLEVGQSFTVGPQLSNSERADWRWTGPDGFTADTREFTITDIQTSQAGIYRLTAKNNLGCATSLDYTISVKDDNLGIDDIPKDSGLSLYPNPASDRIKLTNVSAHSKITIFDINGKELLLTKPIYKNEAVEMDISSLKTGIYFIRVKNRETKVLKLIKR